MGVVVVVVQDAAGRAQHEFHCELSVLAAGSGLLRSMLLSRAVAPGQDVRLSVRCDVGVFAWLMSYIKAQGGRRNAVTASATGTAANVATKQAGSAAITGGAGSSVAPATTAGIKHSKKRRSSHAQQSPPPQQQQAPQCPELGLGNCLEICVASEYLQMPDLMNTAVSFVAAHLPQLLATAPEPAPVDQLPEALLRRVVLVSCGCWVGKWKVVSAAVVIDGDG